jgi:anti-repressor protein
MNKLTNYEFAGKTVRIAIIDNEPWWIAKDVCAILGFTSVRNALSTLKRDEKNILTSNVVINDLVDPHRFLRDKVFQFPVNFVDATKSGKPMPIINEFGLFALTLKSKKLVAKAFCKWTTHEILPQIYKTGACQAQPLTRKQMALMVIENEDAIEKANAIIKEDQPKVDLANKYLDAKNSLTVKRIRNSSK